jgi:FtsH-binding integral membrane protein
MFESEGTLQDRLVNFMYGVYGLMSGALALTAVTAFYISRIPNIQNTLFGSPLLVTLILIGQVALVFGLAMMIQRLTFPMALAMFLVYAVSVGITTSVIFLVYTTASIVQTFVTASAMFGIMTIYGYVTRTDLTRMGNVLVMALWGLLLALLINLFFQSSTADLLISGAAVILFTLLTAYDTQKIKQLGAHLLSDQEMIGKVAVLGALTLYLDFINLFLFLLRFMGRQRD